MPDWVPALLDRAGRGLTSNPDVVIRDVEITSTGWHVLRRTTFDYRRRDGRWNTEQRETYAALYTTANLTGVGGGLADDGEDIQVLEISSPPHST